MTEQESSYRVMALRSPYLPDGSRLRKYRMSKGWTQNDLAIAAGLTVSYVSELERGVKSGGPRGWKRIADALEVSVLDLIEQKRQVDFG